MACYKNVGFLQTGNRCILAAVVLLLPCSSAACLFCVLCSFCMCTAVVVCFIQAVLPRDIGCFVVFVYDFERGIVVKWRYYESVIFPVRQCLDGTSCHGSGVAAARQP
jgi:hypothetical protein